MLQELTLECGGAGAGGVEEGYCMSPLSKAARQASLWWYEAHKAQQRTGAGGGVGGDGQEEGDGQGQSQEWGEEEGVFSMSL